MPHHTNQLRIDTNVLIRYFIGDDPENAEISKAIFEKAENQEVELLLCDTVFLESLFVLERHYKIKKDRYRCISLKV